MTKHIIEFTLPEDTHDLDLVLKSKNYINAIEDMYREFRNRSKYREGEDENTTWTNVHEVFLNIINDNEIEL